MGAYSDDETSKDSQSLSSRGSSGGRNREGQFDTFTTAMCGAIFTTAQTGERPYVCFRSITCRRPEHKDLPRCTLHGYLFSLKKTNKKYYDGILETGTSAAAFQGRQEEVVTSNRSALRSYAASQGTLRSQSSNTPSSHSRQSSSWQQVDSVRLSHLAAAPPDQRGQVQFASPAAVQFTSPITGTATSTQAQVVNAPSDPMAPGTAAKSAENLLASQWALALEMARIELQQGAPRDPHAKEPQTPSRKSRKSSSRSKSGRNNKGRSSRKKKGSYSSSSSSSESEFKSDSEPDRASLLPPKILPFSPSFGMPWC
jgi:hypothetical protein